MKLIDQVCTLEQAKRLSQLGITQGLSIFFWDDYDGKRQLVMNETPKDGYKPDAENTCFSAFTVAELGVMLPNGFDTMRVTGKTIDVSVWQGYDLEGNDFSCEAFETEAECRSAMVIHLLETKVITVEEVNERLCAE